MVNTIKPDGTWSHIDYEDVSNEGFQHSEHAANMVTMARAYKKKDLLFIKAKVKQAITLAFKALGRKRLHLQKLVAQQGGTPPICKPDVADWR